MPVGEKAKNGILFLAFKIKINFTFHSFSKIKFWYSIQMWSTKKAYVLKNF